jgi:lipopolysaccharide assembly LptE-like protein
MLRIVIKRARPRPSCSCSVCAEFEDEDEGRARSTLSLLQLAVGVIALLLAGCAYHLGPVGGQAAGARSVQVRPFSNNALEPRLSEAIVNSVRKSIQRDGTFRLDTSGDADIIVSGTILSFDRSELSFQPGDIITPRDYRVSTVAKVTAVDRSTGKLLVDRLVTGATTLRIGSDQTSAERQAVPLIADDLGRKIASLLAEGSW